MNIFRVRNPVDVFLFFIKLFLPGPGFEPVASRVAGKRCPCILSHQVCLSFKGWILRSVTSSVEFGTYWPTLLIVLELFFILWPFSELYVVEIFAKTNMDESKTVFLILEYLLCKTEKS